MRRVLPLLAALLLLPQLAQAAVTLTVDRARVPRGRSIEAQVRIEGQVRGSPTLQAAEGLEVTPTGQSSEFGLVRGTVTASTTYSYSVMAPKEGRFELGPFEAMVDGRLQRSNTVSVEVVAPASGGGGGEPAPADEPWFATARVSDARPYVGESIVLQVEMGSERRQRLDQWQVALGSTGSLTQEPQPPAEEGRSSRQVGGVYFDTVVQSYPLFAVEPGPVTLDGADVTMLLAGPRSRRSLFAQRRPVRLRTEPVSLNVQPLPAEGRPEDFSGAVGRFRLRAELAPTVVDAGETATLTLVLSGAGALRAPRIELADLGEAVRLYEEDPETSVTLTEGGLTSRAVFRKALVPLRPGEVTISAPRFSYFDPDSGRYAVAKAEPLRLRVEGEAVVDAAVLTRSKEVASAKEQVEVLGSDILPLHEEGAGGHGLRLLSPLALGLLLLPLAGFGGTLVWVRRRDAEGTELGRARERDRTARDARRAVVAAGRAGDERAAEEALRRWLGARLGRSGEALAPDEAAAACRRAGAPDELAASLRGLLERAEGVRYGGEAASGLAEELADWVEEAAKRWR